MCKVTQQKKRYSDRFFTKAVRKGFFSKRNTETEIGAETGFSLVELAIVIAIIGLMMGGVLAMIAPYIEAKNYNATKKKMDVITDSLARFAQLYYTLPCPASGNPGSEAFGVPPGAESAHGFVHTTCGNNARGIVPFRLLGLTEDDIKDAYGNYITYAVPQVFDQYKSNIGTADTDFEVHRDCLSAVWKEGDNVWTMNKAKFCCPAQNGNTLSVLDNRNTGSANRIFASNFGDCALDADWTAGSVPDIPVSCTTPHETEIIAFVLISHGKNGSGSFLRGGGTKTFIGAGATDTQEAGNTALVNQFVSRAINMKRNDDYFDDIVVWRSNRQLIAAFGNNSCAHP